MKRVLRWIGIVAITLLAIASIGLLAFHGGRAYLIQPYEEAIPPSSVQTFEDFLRWQTEINSCCEWYVRGVTYYHVIGPNARPIASGGALYVFDAKGNYVGWSVDCDDVMRNEAIFYPDFWLPKGSRRTNISLEELKKRLLGNRKPEIATPSAVTTPSSAP